VKSFFCLFLFPAEGHHQVKLLTFASLHTPHTVIVLDCHLK